MKTTRASRTRCLRVKTPKAFTLIELLVVISVIAVLMGILLPVLGRVRKQAQSVRCLAHLKHLGTAVAVYATEYDGQFPRSVVPYVGIPRGIRVWELLLGQMEMGDKEAIMLCPAAKRMPDKQPRDLGNGLHLFGGTSHAWWYGGYREIPEMRGSYGSYAYNPSLSWREDRVRGTQGYSAHSAWRSTARIKKPYTVPVILDSQWLEAFHMNSSRGRRPPPSDNWALDSDPLMRGYPYSCINRHRGSVNALFFDSSVRRVGLKELWTLRWDHNEDTANEWTMAGGVQPEDWPKWMRGFKDY